MAQRYEITDMVFRNVGQALLAHQGASVTVKDLQGNNLTVFQGETGGSTFSNPLTSDSNGQIEGWVEAPDFDLAVTGSGISSYTQKVRQSPLGVFDAVSYGAKVDGSTNDAAAWQAALDAAETAGRGTVTCSKRGTTKVNTALTYDGDDLTVELGGVTVDFSGAATSVVLLTVAGSEQASGTGFEALTANAAQGATTLTVATASEFAAGDHVKVGSSAAFDPGRTDQPFGEIVLVSSGVGTTVTLKSPLMGGAYNTADSAFVAKLTLRQNIVVRGGKIKGGGSGSQHVGLFFDRCRRVRVVGVLFEDVEDKAVNCYDCVDAQVRGCTVEGSNYSGRGYGVMFAWACQDSGVFHSRFRDCRHAVTTGGGTSRKGVCRRITYANNWVWDSASTGDAMDAHAAGEHIKFLGNHIFDSANVGINIECASVEIIGNTIHTTASHGIHCHNETAAPTEYLIEGNRLVNCGDATGEPAIRVSHATTSGAGATVRYAKVVGNETHNSGGEGIYVVSTDTWRWKNVTITGNSVNAPAGSQGIILQKADDSSVTGNTVSNIPSASHGIRVSDVTKTAFAGNVCSWASLAASGRGYNVTSAVDCAFTGNTVTLGAQGVVLDSASTNNSVVGNNVRSCTTPLNLSTGAGNIAHSNVGAASIASITAAATVTLVASENDVFTITGNTGITSITASYAGRRVTLIFSGTPTVTDGSNLKLAGNFVAAGTTNDVDTLSLVCDGTNWIEAGRSTN